MFLTTSMQQKPQVKLGPSTGTYNKTLTHPIMAIIKVCHTSKCTQVHQLVKMAPFLSCSSDVSWKGLHVIPICKIPYNCPLIFHVFSVPSITIIMLSCKNSEKPRNFRKFASYWVKIFQILTEF